MVRVPERERVYGSRVREADCRRILVWWCHAGEWYLSRSFALALSVCVGSDVENGSGSCSAEENGKKGRWMEWRLGMIRRRTDWVAGFAR